VPQLAITEQRVGGVAVLTLTGQLVLEEGDTPLRSRIDQIVLDGCIDIVLNMHDVTIIDSCGIGAIVSKFVSLKRRGGHLKLVCPSTRSRHVLEITHLLPFFEVFDTNEAALESFNLATS
jgi:anti-anti-sigma factor